MAALIVGGDNIESIRDELQARGIHQVTHWVGRKHGDKHNVIPRNVELVVVLVDCVNHGLSTKVKKEAKRLRLPVVCYGLHYLRKKWRFFLANYKGIPLVTL